jgi:nucleoside-diphosphate-sugar epimerase
LHNEILLTGVTGFIGSHLCKRLVNDGNHVIGISHSGNTQRIEAIKDKITLYIGDIRNSEFINDIFKQHQIKTVFHLAAQVPYCTDDKDFVGINVDGTLNVVKASIANKVERFIHASTMSIYTIPPAYLPVDELHPTAPRDIYGITKLAGELCLKHVPMKVTILRFAGAYGEYCDNRAVDIFVRSALANQPIKIDGDGLQSSDFTHVDDIVNGIILAWQRGKETVYNIGSGQGTRIKDLVDAILKMTNSKSTVNFVSNQVERPFKFELDISKARKELGYQPHTLKDGIKKYIEAVKRG